MEIAESIEATRQSVIRMFQVLERAALLIMLYSGKNNMQQLAKPEKSLFGQYELDVCSFFLCGYR